MRRTARSRRRSLALSSPRTPFLDSFRVADHPGVVDHRSGLLRFFILYVEVKCEGQRESLEVLRDSPFRDSASGCQNASTLSERGLIDPPKIDVTLVIYRRA